MNKQKGFTIIELIVAVAIIVVLSAIILLNVTAYILNNLLLKLYITSLQSNVLAVMML